MQLEYVWIGLAVILLLFGANGIGSFIGGLVIGHRFLQAVEGR